MEGMLHLAGLAFYFHNVFFFLSFKTTKVPRMICCLGWREHL